MMRLQSVRGATMPETVIVMGILLALLLGITDFSEAIYAYSSVTNAARQGARWAMVRGEDSCAYSYNTLDSCDASQSAVQSHVKSLFIGVINPANATVTARNRGETS
jgi:Flp pilus assembly protein TadG